jgi:hypothetical protein
LLFLRGRRLARIQRRGLTGRDSTNGVAGLWRYRPVFPAFPFPPRLPRDEAPFPSRRRPHPICRSARRTNIRSGSSNASASATSCSKSRSARPSSILMIMDSDKPLRRASSTRVCLRRIRRARTLAPRARTNAAELFRGARGGDIGTQSMLRTTPFLTVRRGASVVPLSRLLEIPGSVYSDQVTTESVLEIRSLIRIPRRVAIEYNTTIVGL